MTTDANPRRAQGRPADSITTSPRAHTLACAAALVLAAVTAWHNSFSVPFVYDDVPAIVGNASMRSLWPPWHAFFPGRPDLTVSGRPLANFSFALDHAISGTAVWSYHVTNLVMHVLAALTLFGIVRRTLAPASARDARSKAPARFRSAEAVRGVTDPAEPIGNASTLVALSAALLWMLHPLQTESVTYVVQRVESLMGLFFLLTLYCAIRANESSRSAMWQALAVFACLAGMATKEVMVVAPLVVLLYERTFVTGDFRAAVRRRAWMYAGLAATWLVLAALVASGGGRGGSAGFGSAMPWWDYALVQLRALVLYLRLAFWPAPLVFDYGIVESHGVGAALPPGVIVLLLAAGTLVALARNSRLGFPGAAFFLVLAPSSSVVPVATETIAEHRMYLPLAAVLTLVAAGVFRLLGPRRGLALIVAAACALGWTTFARNRDYTDAFTLWSDTAHKRPDNARALNNLGSEWMNRARLDEAEQCFSQALALQPHYASAHYNLGVVFLKTERLAGAVLHFERAVEIEEDFADAHVNLAHALLALNRVREAIAHYEVALRLQPAAADAHESLAQALSRAGREAEALPHLAQVVRLQPARADAHFALANAFAQAGRFDEAVGEYRETLRLDPANIEARNNLGNALLVSGRVDDAIRTYEEILHVRPSDASILENLQQARAMRAALPPPR